MRVLAHINIASDKRKAKEFVRGYVSGQGTHVLAER